MVLNGTTAEKPTFMSGKLYLKIETKDLIYKALYLNTSVHSRFLNETWMHLLMMFSNTKCTTLRNTNLQRKKSFEKAAFVEICISVTANVSKLKACVRPHVNVRWTFISSSRALFPETLKKRNIYGIIRIRRTLIMFKNHSKSLTLQQW